jgi:hypothetical protein
VPDDLGFAVPVSRRDLAALRDALTDLHPGAAVTAVLRTPEHGRFAVSGRVRRDLTDTGYKIGWFDLTGGNGTDPVADLQVLAPADSADAEPQSEVDLHAVVAGLADGDVVTADFEFEGCGAFTIAGGVRRDELGTRWVLAGHHVACDGVPAERLRRLVVDRVAADR